MPKSFVTAQRSLVLFILFALLASPLYSAITEYPKPYEGKTLKVLSFYDNHALAVFSHLPEFERLTGAYVDFDMVRGDMLNENFEKDRSNDRAYDLYTIDEPFIPSSSSELLPLAKWPQPLLFAAENLEPHQFVKASVRSSQYKKQHYGIPINANVYLYVYRSDLFHDVNERITFKKRYKYPLAPALSPQHIRDIAEFFYRPPHLYGFAPFTRHSEGATVEATWAWALHGTQVIDEHNQLVLDRERAIAGLQFYKDLLQFAPPNTDDWIDEDKVAAYNRGSVAQMMEWPSFLNEVEASAFSRVAGINGYQLSPRSNIGKHTGVTSTWTLGLAKDSTEKELAAEFASWWSSLNFGRTMIQHGMNPARQDLLSDVDLNRANPWFRSVRASFNLAPHRPRCINYPTLSKAIATAFIDTLEGHKTAEAAVDELFAKLDQLKFED